MTDRRRPYRNRVTPLGDIVATPEYGTLMGNRGCLHDNNGNIVRQASRSAWISCLPRWPGIRRTLMRPGHYTELFFLDEPTALAAGHRPCGACRPEALSAFKAAWAKAHRLGAAPRATHIDRRLACERGRIVPCDTPGTLPDGAMVTDGETKRIWLRWHGQFWRWSFKGYGTSRGSLGGPVYLVTPPACLVTLAAGYRPLPPPIQCVTAPKGCQVTPVFSDGHSQSGP